MENKKRRVGLWIVLLIMILVTGGGFIGLRLFFTQERVIETQLHLGEKYLTELNYQEAIVAFSKVLELEPRHMTASLGLAEAYMGSGQEDLAIAVLVQAQEQIRQSYDEEDVLFLDSVSVLEYLAGVYENRGNLEEAEEVRRQLNAITGTPSEEPSNEEESQLSSASETSQTEPSEIETPKKVASVKFESSVDGEEGSIYAVITGVDEDGESIWVHETGRHMIMDFGSVVQEIGMYEDRYYFIENGAVVAINSTDGSVLWRNEDSGCDGFGVAFEVAEDGTLYICGYAGLDFMAVDKDGNTLKRIENFDLSYYWPIALEREEDIVKVTMSCKSPNEEYGEYVFCVNTEDYTHYMEGREETVAVEADATPVYDTLEPWQEAYLKYIEENHIGNFPNLKISLVYIDEDEIPEAVIWLEDVPGGIVVCAFSEDGVNYMHAGRFGISYIEKSGLLEVSDGDSVHGYWFDKIYRLQDGKFECIGEGSQVGEYWEDTDEITCTWNGTEVTPEEYEQKLNEMFDSSKAVEEYGYGVSWWEFWESLVGEKHPESM